MPYITANPSVPESSVESSAVFCPLDPRFWCRRRRTSSQSAKSGAAGARRGEPVDDEPREEPPEEEEEPAEGPADEPAAEPLSPRERVRPVTTPWNCDGWNAGCPTYAEIVASQLGQWAVA